MLYACRHILYIELRGVYEPGTEGIFHSLMGGVDRQLAEDVLAVRVHGVDGAYAVLRYLLRGASARNGLEHVNLCRREQAFVPAWLCRCSMSISVARWHT